MMHPNHMICIWFSPTKMNISNCCHNAWMFVRYNTKSHPLSYLVSNTCQEPSSTFNIPSFSNRKCQQKQLIISITTHSNHLRVFILLIQMCTINNQYGPKMIESFNRWMKCLENVLKYLSIMHMIVKCFQSYNTSRIFLL